jgi:hypothetical protein
VQREKYKQTKAGAPAQRVEGVKGYESNSGKHSGSSKQGKQRKDPQRVE